MPQFQNGYTTSNVQGSQLQQTEWNDCTVRAVANAAGIQYDDAHALCKKFFKRRFRQGTQTRLIVTESHKLFKSIGFEVEKRTVSEYFNLRGTFGTINQFVKRHPRGRYLLSVRGHSLAIVDGVAYDNASRTSGRHRVLSARKLTPVGTTETPVVEAKPKSKRVKFAITKDGLRYENLTPKQVFEIVGGNLASVQSICAKRRPQVYGWALTFE